jgi:hypothetical protein
MAKEDLMNADPDGRIRTLRLVQDFILHGEYPSRARGREGRMVRVAEARASRRQLYYVAIRSFFAHSNRELPRDKKFKIQDSDNVAPNESFMELGTARAIIGALKEPYKTLATIALYAGMGRKEALSLNRIWKSQIVPQLEAGKDPVRVDFVKRKTNVRLLHICSS